MSQSLWAGVGTPAVTNASDGAPGLTLGTVVYANVDGRVRGVSWRFPDTLPSGTVTGLLYGMTALGAGDLLASAAFAAPVAGAWCTQLFAAPVAVAADDPLIVAIWTPDRYVATSSFWDDGAVTSGDLVGVQDGTDPFGLGATRNGRFNSGAAPAFPANTFNATNYWVDVLFTAGHLAAGEGAGFGGVVGFGAGSKSVAGAGAGWAGGFGLCRPLSSRPPTMSGAVVAAASVTLAPRTGPLMADARRAGPTMRGGG